MPEATKKPTGNAKARRTHGATCNHAHMANAPAIVSPAKPKVQDKKASKEAVKLPSITPPANGSSPKKVSKAEATGVPSPNGPASKTLTPTSPSRPNAKHVRPSGKPNLAPVTPTAGERRPELGLNGDSGERPAEAAITAPSEEAGSTELHIEADPPAPDNSNAEAVAAAAAKAREEEAARLRKENGNGMIKLIYEQYDELFPIVDGSTTQANVDEVYCLSFVMPNCLVHLSLHPDAERFERENRGVFDSLVPEEPRGTYHDLVKDQTYFVVVEQEADQLRRDQEATKAKWAPAVQQDKLQKDDGRGFETCSCIYGNPCVDEYGCKDWHSRFAVAMANGWKGF